jgi:anti-sigma-K factor RskA
MPERPDQPLNRNHAPDTAPEDVSDAEFDELLALYALGALAPAEAEQVAARLASDAAARAQLALYQQSSAKIALALPPKPARAGLRNEFFAKIRAERQQNTSTTAISDSISLLPTKPKSNNYWRWHARVAWFGFAVAVGILAVLIPQATRLRDQRNELLLQVNSLQSRLGSSQSLQQQVANASLAPRLMLKAPAGANEGWAAKLNGQMVMVHRFGSPPSGRTWQAWAIVDGKAMPLPVFAGTITVIPLPAGATAVAISEEPLGGSKQPTKVRAIGAF